MFSVRAAPHPLRSLVSCLKPTKLLNKINLKPVFLDAGTLAMQANDSNFIVTQTTMTGASGTTFKVLARTGVGTGYVGNANFIADWSANLADMDIASGGQFGLRGDDLWVDALNGGGDLYHGFNSGGGAGTRTVTMGVDHGSGNFSGIIHGDGSSGTLDTLENGVLAVTKIGTGTQILSGSAANTYLGITLVNEGELHLGKTPAMNAIVGSNVFISSTGSAATMKLLASNQIADTTDVTIFNLGLFDLNGFDETINNLLDDASGGSTVDGGTGTPTLTVASGDFSGTLQDTAGSLSLVKNTGGTLFLRHVNNTHSGDTTVSGGVLALVNAGSNNNIASSKVIEVAAGATLNVNGLDGGPLNTLVLASGQTLGGGGTVLGNLDVGGGGTVAPGSSAGLLTVNGNHLWNNGDNYAWEVAQAGTAGVDYDSIVVHTTLNDGTLDFTAVTSEGIDLQLSKLPGGGFSSTDLFALWTFDNLVGWDTGTGVGNPSGLFTFTNFGGILTGGAIVFSDTANESGPGTIFLTGLVPTPEPSTATLAAVGLLLLALAGWRRRER